MKIDYLIKEEAHTRLILIFTGWSMGPELYAGIRIPGWDVAVVHDFTELSLPADPTEGYYTVYLFAWSMGVMAAERLLKPERVTEAFAINGTGRPADDLYGIPTAIFMGTAENLAPGTLKKFWRRMGLTEAAGCKPAATDRRPDGPRTMDAMYRVPTDCRGLGDQLRRIAQMGAAERRIRWTRAYIGGRDRIFPPANMERYWSEDPDTEIVRDPEGLHLPDMEGIIRSVIADPGRVSRRFAGASSSYDTHAIAQRTATIRMGIKLERKIAGLTGRILEIGPGTGLFTREYSRFLHPEEATFIDITEVGPFGIAPTEHYHQGDAERWIEDDRTLYDCILSTSAIQWFADIPRFLAHCAERLRPGGTLALSTFLPGNLEELDRLRPTPLRYPTPELLRDALARSFDEIEIEPDEIRVEFRSVREMLMHLKHTGVAGSAPGGGGLKLSEMSELRTLTYRPVYLTARRK